MKAQTIGCFAFKSNQQSFEFIHPSKASLNAKTVIINVFIEMPFPTSSNPPAITPIPINIRNDTVIPTHFSSLFAVKSWICIEIRTFYIEWVTVLWDIWKSVVISPLAQNHHDGFQQ